MIGDVLEILTNSFAQLLRVISPLFECLNLGSLLLGMFFVYSVVRFLLMPLLGVSLAVGSDVVSKSHIDYGFNKIEEKK